MPLHKIHQDRWPFEMPLWHLPFLQVDHAPLPGDSGTLGSELWQAPFQAMSSPFAHLSKDPHLSLLKTKRQEMPSQAKMSCQPLSLQGMHLLLPSIVPPSAPFAPTCTDSQAGLSRKQGVAMHRMRQRNHSIVQPLLQFVVESIRRFSRKLSPILRCKIL